MSDSDLTALLEAHRDFGDVYPICRCGWRPTNLTPGTHAAHVASVLSGVYAITPLPEPDEDGEWAVGKKTIGPGARGTGWILDHQTGMNYTPERARQLAAALFAAARAQETPQ